MLKVTNSGDMLCPALFTIFCPWPCVHVYQVRMCTISVKQRCSPKARAKNHSSRSQKELALQNGYSDTIYAKHLQNKGVVRVK